MNRKVIGILVIGILSLALTGVACGDGASGDGDIRVEKGLAAAGQPSQGASSGVTGDDVASIDADVAESAPSRGGISAPVAVGESGFAADAAYPQGVGRGFAPYPTGSSSFFQQQEGLNVQGYGSATAPATSARLQIFVRGNGSVKPLPACEAEPCPEPLPRTELLTEEQLQPIVDAIKAQGIGDHAIEIDLNPNGYYYDPYSAGPASITVTISDPGERVQAIATAASEAANATGTLYIENFSTTYSVDAETCARLDRESMTAAIQDARERAGVLAEVLEVGVGNVIFVSHYSYSPFYGTSPCSPEAIAYPEYYGGNFNGKAEVTVTSNVSVSFEII